MRVYDRGPKIITYTFLGAPYYNFSIMGPRSPILFMKAPYLIARRASRSQVKFSRVGVVKDYHHCLYVSTKAKVPQFHQIQ